MANFFRPRETTSTGSSTNKNFGPKFLAEYSMGQYDYERYHKLLGDADFLAFHVLNKNVNALQPFFATLITIYSNFRPLVYETYRKKYDDFKNESMRLKKEWDKIGYNSGQNTFPVTYANTLIEFWQEILVLKQLIGLGSIVRRDESQRTKLNRAAGLTD